MYRCRKVIAKFCFYWDANKTFETINKVAHTKSSLRLIGLRNLKILYGIFPRLEIKSYKIQVSFEPITKE